MPTRKVPAIQRPAEWWSPGWALAGIVVGVIATVVWLDPKIRATQAPHVLEAKRSLARPVYGHPVRAQNGKLTHPLLTCAADTLGPSDLTPLEAQVRTLLAGAQRAGVMRAAVHVSDLETCESFEIGAAERFHPASMMKLPLALTWLRRASQDGAVLAKQLTYEMPDTVDTREDRKLPTALVNGQSYEVADLLRRMLVDSRNDAKFLLTQNVPVVALDEIWVELGLTPPPRDRDPEISVHDIATMLHALYDGAFLGRDASERALGWLAEATFKEGLNAQLPPGAVVAHKYGRRVHTGAPRGSWQLQLHDCGVLYRPGHPMVACVMTEGDNEVVQQRLIQEIAALLWSYPQASN